MYFSFFLLAKITFLQDPKCNLPAERKLQSKVILKGGGNSFLSFSNVHFGMLWTPPTFTGTASVVHKQDSGATDSESDRGAQTSPCPSRRLLLLHSALPKFIGVHPLCPGCAEAGHCLHPCLAHLSSPLSLPGSTSITSPEGITASTSHTPPPPCLPSTSLS